MEFQPFKIIFFNISVKNLRPYSVKFALKISLYLLVPHQTLKLYLYEKIFPIKPILLIYVDL